MYLKPIVVVQYQFKAKSHVLKLPPSSQYQRNLKINHSMTNCPSHSLLLWWSTLKGFVKEHITSRLSATFDPSQFAYWPNRSTEDVISTAPYLSLANLEENTTHVRMLFLDFSSAFNTIIPQHLVDKLGPLGFSTPLCNWLLEFLAERPQSVQVGQNTSSVITLSTDSP